MFSAQLLRIIGWLSIAIVAVPALFLLSAAVLAGMDGGLAALGLGVASAAGTFLLGAAGGAVLIALASVTEDVRDMRNHVLASKPEVCASCGAVAHGDPTHCPGCGAALA